MKKIVFLFTLLLLITSCSEKEVELKSLVERNGLVYAVNDKDPYSGIAFEKFSNEQFQIKGVYKDGKKSGEWIEYYENGQVKKKENYKNGSYDGVIEKYNNQGSPLLLTSYKNGELDGNYKEYNNGELSIDCNYKVGNLNGNYKRYSNGTLLLDCNYKDGNYDGAYKQYNNNGVTTIETNYKNGLVDGKYIERFDNGNNKLEYSMNEGNYIDDYIYYNVNGTIKKHKYYKNDGTNINKGKWTIYYDKKWNEVSSPNEFYRIINFTDDGKKSIVKDYYNNGKVQMEGEYSSIDPDTKNGTFKWYSKKGVLTMKGNFVNGERNGVWESYYDRKNIEGTLLKERAHYKNGLLHGKYEYWENPNYNDKDYQNKDISIYPVLLTDYKPQTQNGYWKLNGQLKNGKLDGKWKVWLMARENFCWYKLNIYTTAVWNNGKNIENCYLSYNAGKNYDVNGNVVRDNWKNYRSKKPLYCREPGFY